MVSEYENGVMTTQRCSRSSCRGGCPPEDPNRVASVRGGGVALACAALVDIEGDRYLDFDFVARQVSGHTAFIQGQRPRSPFIRLQAVTTSWLLATCQQTESKGQKNEWIAVHEAPFNTTDTQTCARCILDLCERLANGRLRGFLIGRTLRVPSCPCFVVKKGAFRAAFTLDKSAV